MPQLPSLSNLFLGVPTAGNSKKDRGKERKKAKEASDSFYKQLEQELDQEHAEIFWGYRQEILDSYDMVDIDYEDVALHYLREMMRYHYIRGQVDGWIRGDALKLWDIHNDICDRLRLKGSSAPWPYFGDELEVDEMIEAECLRAARYVFKNYVARSGVDQPKRKYAEGYRLLNDRDMMVQLARDTRIANVELYPNHVDSVFLERTKHYWVRLENRLREGGPYEPDRRAAQPPATRREPRAPRPPPAPAPPKSRAQYNANKAKYDERVAKEAAEALALKAERDAVVAQSRAEAEAKAKREEQEREDALRHQEERNAAGSSRDHGWQEDPLSPGSAAKQLVEAQQAREAKQQDIEAQRERIRLAVEAKKKEMAEQQRLADERARALKVANVYDHAAAAPKKDKD